MIPDRYSSVDQIIKGGFYWKQSGYKNYDELSLMLTVPDMANVLGIGLAHAYEIARRRDFPTVTLGARIIIPWDKFMDWRNRKAEEKYQ